MRRQLAVTLLLLVPAFSGCGSPNDRQPLSGTVLLNGVPLDNGAIKFDPTTPDQKYATGAMIQAGKFDISGEFGLTPGTYKVVITSMEFDPSAPPPVAKGPGGAPPPVMRERVPSKYNSQSNVTVVVKPDRASNRFDFDIKDAQ